MVLRPYLHLRNGTVPSGRVPYVKCEREKVLNGSRSNIIEEDGVLNHKSPVFFGIWGMK